MVGECRLDKHIGRGTPALTGLSESEREMLRRLPPGVPHSQRMKETRPGQPDHRVAWRQAREGDLRGAQATARARLAAEADTAGAVDMHLVLAFCAMRAGQYAEAASVLEEAATAAQQTQAAAWFADRVAAWNAELAYFRGRYSVATEIVDRVVDRFEGRGDHAYAAFALRIRMAVHLARTEYAPIQALAERALANARKGDDPYALVQVLNVLGAAHFDHATTMLPEAHARAHLSSLDLHDMLPMREEASRALRHFEDARRVAIEANYAFAAWYVSGNIERLEILLGHAKRALPAIRKRLRVLQQRGARYDELVTRSNLAWALRTNGQFEEALHELDAAFQMARQTGTFNVLLEFLEYDRSIVLRALGDLAGAQASYRRYLRLVNSGGAAQPAANAAVPHPAPRRPLEPHFLKVADRYAREHLGEKFSIQRLALHCGVGTRTLEKAFASYRGVTPVAHIRNLRLDRAHAALVEENTTVRDVALRFGFRSPTTFTNEYRKRFGTTPSRRREQFSLP